MPRLITGHFEDRPRFLTLRPNGGKSWLFIHTLSGTGRFFGAAANPGSAFLVRPGTPQEYGTVGSRWEILWAHFHAWPQWLEWLPKGGFSHLERMPPSAKEALWKAHRLAPEDDLLAMNAIEESLLHSFREEPGSSLDPRVRDALVLIRKRLPKPISVAALAAEVGLSHSRLHRLFLKETTESPGKAIDRIKRERAEDLLRLSSLPITAIADACGYPSVFAFSRTFKAQTGSSPTAYRAASAGLELF